ncbi:UNVERIFIED_CONTAM: hypothetical protein RMT77_006699 [Armadillidium vulgare]
MVGAMPAVAVRQQRKHIRHEEHKQRPSTLTIDQGQHQAGGPTPLKSPRTSPHHSPAHSQRASPITSPKGMPHKQLKQLARSQKQPQTCVNGYLFGRISLLHVSVICVFLGITLLVVGLVQLAPGARYEFCNTEMNKYAIIGSGTGFLALGFLILIMLCACQKRSHKKRRHQKGQSLQKKGISKSRSMSSKGNSKTNIKTPTRHMQVQTVDGALAAAGANSSKSSRGRAEVHPSHQPPVSDFRVINEKEMSVEAFVKSPSESDALLQQTNKR